MSRLHSQVADKGNASHVIGDSRLAEVEKRRIDATKSVQKNRKRRLNVLHGKSISTFDLSVPTGEIYKFDSIGTVTLAIFVAL